MKINSIVLLSILTLGPHMASASTLGLLKLEGRVSNEVHHKGSVTLSNAQAMQEVNVMGKLLADKIIFNKSVICSGIANLSNATLKDVSEFKGIVNLKNGSIDNDMSIKSDHGSKLEDTKFKGNLSFVGNDISLTGSTQFKKMFVNPSTEHPEIPKIHLGSGVVIDGSIEFEGTAGKVVLSQGALFKGTVINGEIIKE